MALPSLNAVQEQFLKVFDLGRVELAEDASSLLQIVVTLEVVLAGLYLALGANSDLSQIAKKILKIGLFSWIVNNYDYLLTVLLDGFLYAGEKAAGASALDLATLRNPDLLIKEAFRIVTPAFGKVFELEGNGFFGLPTLDNIIVLFCVSLGFIGLLSLALQIFVTYIEFMVISAAGFILVPLGVFPPFAFIAEKVFGAIISFGVKLLVLSVIIGVSHSIMKEMTLSETLSWQEVWNFLLTSAALFFLSFHAPSVAQTLLYGTPTLSAGGFLPAYAGGVATGAFGAGAASDMVFRAAKTAQSGAYVTGAALGMSLSNRKTGPTNSSQISDRNVEALRGDLYGGFQGFARGVGAATYNATLKRPLEAFKNSFAAGHAKGISLQGRRPRLQTDSSAREALKDAHDSRQAGISAAEGRRASKD